jgi:hypothetical protein
LHYVALHDSAHLLLSATPLNELDFQDLGGKLLLVEG